MLKRKREEKQSELKEKLEFGTEIKVRRETLTKIKGRYHVKLKYENDEGFLDEMVKKHDLNVLTIIFKLEDSNFLKNIPSQITRLRLMSHFNYPIDNIPDTIQYLEISSWFDQKINRLPTNLTHLEFGDTYEDIQRIDSFPNSLVYLKLPKYPYHLDNLPSGLQQLVVGKVKSVSNLPNKITHITIKANVPIEDIPESVEYLNLDGDFNLPVDNLPRNLKRLTLGPKFNLPLGNLPDCLEELEISDSFNQPIYTLPPNLKVLKLGNRFNSKIYSMGDKLEYISFGFAYELDLDMLPASVNRIDKQTSLYSVQHVIKKNKIFNSYVPVDRFPNLRIFFEYSKYQNYIVDIKIGNEIFNIELLPKIEHDKWGYKTQTSMEKYSNVFKSAGHCIKVKGSSSGLKYILEFKKIV